MRVKCLHLKWFWFHVNQGNTIQAAEVRPIFLNQSQGLAFLTVEGGTVCGMCPQWD